MECYHLLKENHKLKGVCHGGILHTPSRMFLFTNVFLGASLFLIANTGISIISGFPISIGGRSQQRFRFSAKRLSHRAMLSSVWIATSDAYHNIIAANDGRGRIILYWAFMSEWNFPLRKYYYNASTGVFHPTVFSPHIHLYFMCNTPTWFHPSALNVDPVAL